METSKTCANGSIQNVRKWRAKRAAPVSKIAPMVHAKRAYR